MRKAWNRIKFTPAMRGFLRENYLSMTNRQLADALGLKLTRVRNELYSMGLKRMELRKWTEAEVEFLTANYRTMGDKEIGRLLGRTNKMVCKKRGYLKLKRTAAEVLAVKRRNNRLYGHGYPKGHVPDSKRDEGEEWQRKGCPYGYWYVKLGGRIRKRADVVWERHNGPIPEGMFVRHREGYSDDSIGNLMLVDRAEHARLNYRAASPEKRELAARKISSSHRQGGKSDLDMLLMGYVPEKLSDGSHVWA